MREVALDAELLSLARTHYENFTVVSGLVPRAQRPHMARLYAYCRTVDDLGDEGDFPPERRLALLDAWEADLRRAWTDEAPSHPVLSALVPTVRAFDLPADPFLRLVEANRMDQRQTRYPTFDALRHYCRHSADPVGELVLGLFGCADPARVALSDAVCTGLQLANFWQDVTVDLGKGRIYLPAEDLTRFGVVEADLARPSATPAVRELLAFEVERARGLLRAGAALVHEVPRGLRAPLGMFVRGGLAILDAVARQDHDVLCRRPTVSKVRKVRIAVGTLASQAVGSW